jgi:hypothetical protein
METTLTFNVAINDVEQPGAVTIDVSTPPAGSTYTLSGAWGEISITTAYNPSSPDVLKILNCTMISGTIAPSDTYRFAGVRLSDTYYVELPYHQLTSLVLWTKSNNAWKLSTNVGTVTLLLYTPRVVFDANGGVGAPAEIAGRFGVPFALPASVPTRKGYVFAGWLPSKPNDWLHPREYWYSTQEPYEESGTTYIDAATENISALLPVGASARIFRRLLPEESVVIDISDIKVRSDDSGTSIIQSMSRPNLYQCLIESFGPVKLFALWHRCSHWPIRDKSGRLLRGPDGRILRDD